MWTYQILFEQWESCHEGKKLKLQCKKCHEPWIQLNKKNLLFFESKSSCHCNMWGDGKNPTLNGRLLLLYVGYWLSNCGRTRWKQNLIHDGLVYTTLIAN